MARFEDAIEVDVPVRIAYDQWTQFEEFPRFMDGVESVKQLDDKRLAWVATIAGQREEWLAEIVDQVSDQRIAWKSIEGAPNAGVVLFEPLGPDRARITLRIDAEPEGPVESIGTALGLLERRVSGDLKRFKGFIEAKVVPTGAWRGEIHGDRVSER
jgi:uncharacterized membrane protein